MGLFFNRKKKQQEVEISKEELVSALAKEMVSSMFGHHEPSPERMAEMEERDRLAEEGRVIRRERIAEQGVDVESFTDAKIEADAIWVLDTFSPRWRALRLARCQKQISGDFQNLTKTGKLPKNVFEGHFYLDESPANPATPADSAILHIKYLKDGVMNMADVHLWRNQVRHGYSVRIVDGEYRITSITSTDLRRNLEDTLFLNQSPESNDEAVALLDGALRKSW